MKVVDELMEVAARDTELLVSLDEKGDRFYMSRDVDFLLRAPDQERAELVANFVNDYRYGLASVEESDGDYSVLVVVNMPIKQNEIIAVSGFMVCLCNLYDLEYDGWGCVVQSEPQT